MLMSPAEVTLGQKERLSAVRLRQRRASSAMALSVTLRQCARFSDTIPRQ
jgi:hypothetical protein